MADITNIDRQTMNMLSEELNKLLTAWGARRGLDVRMLPGRYGGANAQFHFETNVKSTPSGKSGAQVKWNQFCRMFGLIESDFGLQFMMRGETYRVSGILPNRPKWAIEVTRVRDSKTLLVEPKTISLYRPKKAS